ncbi:MAG: Hsp20/alpha crystallin family protein [Nitrospirota bacterium]|nr:Hsp20/alpha crystallin family protein [Nitrospirota bacterium]
MKWNPYTELERELERSVNGLFDRPLGLRPIWDDRNAEALAWQPPVNVYEDKDYLAIEAQLPGIDLNDIELSVKEQTLHLRGERKSEAEKSKEGYHLREAHYGKFSRSFSLPSTVKPDEAKATYDKGVLTIMIPKQEKAKPRTIQIEAK